MTILSMTGFGQASSTSCARVISVEIRSVNHRFAETAIRIAREYSALEEHCRSFFQHRLIRGRAEVTVSIVNRDGASQVNIDWVLLRHLLQAEADIAEQVASGPATAYQWLMYPGVAALSTPTDDVTALWTDVLPVLEGAAAQWQTSREREGSRLEADLRTKVLSVRGLVNTMTAMAPQVLAESESKLRERVHRFAKQVDDARLWTELAILLDKLSIDEELLRLCSHLAEFSSSLENAGAVGRRLDFLIQEMHREVNTIGSKSANISISRIVVDAKTIIEQMREQVQNIA